MEGSLPAWLRATADGAACADPLPGHVGTGRLRGRRALVVGRFAPEARPGRVAAAALAKEGAAVAVAGADHGGAARTPGAAPLAPGVLETAALLNGLGAHTLPLHCDPGDEGACRRAVAYTALDFGGIDLLVVCGDPPPPAERMTELEAASLEDSLRGSVFGTFWLARAAYSYMSEGAAVVVTSSGAGRDGAPEHIGYAAGAAGVMNLVRSLAAPMRERGVAINCLVCDGAEEPHRTARAYLDLATATPARETGGVLGVPGG